ncbi:MAG: glycerophosphodiester phosphodiesterase family protein [Tateyamaria sp.]|nr:glycerophosphodiester phosphodiesterase family protein [Tateyamaria sp.]
MIPKLNVAFLDAPITHRALHNATEGRPENSRTAIRAAISHGYAIEIDVQLSADNQAMVFHDYTLDRLTAASGRLRSLSLVDLSKIRLNGCDEGIPALPEILEIVSGQVPVVIELKDQDGAMGPKIGPLEAAIADTLEQYKGPVAVMSFNPHSVARMAELCPCVPRGLVTSEYAYSDWPLPVAICDHLREIPDYDRVGASFISHEVTDLARGRVAELKRAGADVLCWTVKSPEVEAEALEIADNITFEGYLA